MSPQTISIEARAELLRIGQLAAQRGELGAVSAEAGEFLHMLVLAAGYRRGLEIGTSYGYSGLWISSALRYNGGVFTTIDIDAAMTAQARDVFARAALGDAVEVVHASADAALQEVHGPFDFVFIDADSTGARHYFDLIWPKLAQRATIVTHNVLTQARELSDFVAHLRGHSQLSSATVRIGGGLEVSLKLAAGWTTTSLDGADWII